MIATIEGNAITLDFSDEVPGVPLCLTTVEKDIDAVAYISVFEKDMRRLFSDLFPTPEPDPQQEEMM